MELKFFLYYQITIEFVSLGKPENIKICTQQNEFTFSCLISEIQEIVQKHNRICLYEFFGFNNTRIHTILWIYITPKKAIINIKNHLF